MGGPWGTPVALIDRPVDDSVIGGDPLTSTRVAGVSHCT
jgi:hypothetical protein